MNKILILEDNERLAGFYSNILIRNGYNTFYVHNSDDFFDIYTDELPDVIILDIKLNNSKLSGLEVFERLKKHKQQGYQVIVLSGEASRSEIATAMKLGAFTFIEKTGEFNIDKFLIDVKSALTLKSQEDKNRNLEIHNRQLREQIKSINPLIGESPAIQEVKEKIKILADVEVDVLITGETGTGKEVVASNLYWESSLAGKPFVRVNAGGLPETLVDSELFGHLKGAFTDAKADKKGYFQRAEGGVLFLDEISNLSYSIQAKILRAIENKEINIVGGRSRKVDVRLFFASNKDLKTLSEKGNFREDLYYRLSGNIINLPPLRERDNDIILLMKYFIKKNNVKYNCPLVDDIDDLKSILLSYNWPGNIRELMKFCEYLCIMNDEIDKDKIIKDLEKRKHGYYENPSGLRELMKIEKYQEAMVQFEKKYLNFHIKKNGGKIANAAREIGLNRTTIYKKINKY